MDILTMTLIGNVRVSTAEQAPALQVVDFELAGWARVFSETVSGAKADRLGLVEAQAYLRAEDVQVV